MIRAFHQYDGRGEIEVGWLELVFGQKRFVVGGDWRRGRVLFDGSRSVRDSGGGPRVWFGDAGASECSRDFRLLAHFLTGGRSRATSKSDDLRGRKLLRKIVWRSFAGGIGARRKWTHLDTGIFREGSGNEEHVFGLDRAFFDA